MPDFLLELGLEEIPARMIASAQAELALRVREMLGRERLITGDARIESFSTPRRLAVLVSNVAAQQADATENLLGPPLKAAYKNGEPTPAAYAFAKKSGLPLDELRTMTNSKGEYLAATVTDPGKPAAQVIAAELPREIAAIYWAKNMYWRAGKPERFVRPLQWIVALLDDEVVPLEWAGKTAGRFTCGHRILHGPAPLRIESPASYKQQLRQAHVLADVEERRHRIRKDLDHVTRTLPGARWREDHELVDKVTHLTEWPTVLLGSFHPEYLQLPEEVLVTVMRDHQNYFAPEGPDGKLLPNFLAVLNTEPGDAAATAIRQGNERVLRARFNDARFFYDFDQRIQLTERVALLANVTFQKQLGSYAQKTERLLDIAMKLGGNVQAQGHPVGLQELAEAAGLAKTDLTTELVKEFTELQGIVGGLYARAQGASQATSQAIYDHYLPKSMSDPTPRTTEGLLLSIADRIDTVAGMFTLGLQPTGSKDPFALRRAANGIVKILAESNLPLTLQVINDASLNGSQQVLAFFAERLEWYLREVRGDAYDVINAVMATSPVNVRDAMARVDAVTRARGTEDFAAISAAFKRMRNIVEQGRARGDTFAQPEQIDVSLREAAEITLAREAARQATAVEALQAIGNYDAALQAIASLRPSVDAFFDQVMVMAPEAELRSARLALLRRITRDFSSIADFSEIVSEARPVS